MSSGRHVPSVFAKKDPLRTSHSAGEAATPRRLEEQGAPSGLVGGLVEQAVAILGRQPPFAPSNAWPPSARPSVVPAVPDVGGLPQAPQGLEGFDIERLRRHVHEVVETIIAGFVAKGPATDRVPLVRAEAPVEPGGEATALIRIANEDGIASEISLYCTNFVADSGHEIPALRTRISPRVATIPPKGEVIFELKIAIPFQVSAGVFSGLVQANGAKYVKAVVSVEVK